jgi:hypothetical protein
MPHKADVINLNPLIPLCEHVKKNHLNIKFLDPCFIKNKNLDK